MLREALVQLVPHRWSSLPPPAQHSLAAYGPVVRPSLVTGAQGLWWGLPQAVLCSCPFVLDSHQVPLQLLMRSGCKKEEALLVDCFCKKQAKMKRREGWAWCHRARPYPCPPGAIQLISPLDGGNIEKN